MNTERKIVFFDVDGTIYEINRGTPDSTREALEKLKAQGHIPILCTGRPKASMFPEVLDLNFPGMICGAGTYIVYEGRVLRNLLLPGELLLQEVPRLEKIGCCVVLEGPEYLSCRMNEETFRLFSIVERLKKEYPERLKEMDLLTDRVSKLTVKIPDMAAFERMAPELQRAFELARYERMPYVEMMPKGISKADGIRILLEELDIPLCNTYAFGDGPNDLEMLQYVQYGTAMGNAEEVVLQTAKYRTEGIWEDGVARALERYGLI